MLSEFLNSSVEQLNKLAKRIEVGNQEFRMKRQKKYVLFMISQEFFWNLLRK